MAWDTYYTDEHFETVLKRARADRMSVGKVMSLMLWFYGFYKLENLHPLEGGYFRHKYRLDRRPNMPIENPLIFYPKRAWNIIKNHAILLTMLRKYAAMRRRIKADPNAFNYSDDALKPILDDREEDRKLSAN